MVPTKPQIDLARVADLAEHDQNCDAEPNRNSELHYDQNGTQGACATLAGTAAVQYRSGSETGQDQRWVAAAQEARRTCNGQNQCEEWPVGPVVEGNGPLQEAV